MTLALAVLPRSTDFALMLNDPPGIFKDRDRPSIFVDSSFTDGLCGIIIQTPTWTKFIRYSIPTVFSSDQQAAELWGLCKAIKVALFFGLSNPIIIGDNTGALYDLISLKSPTRRWWRILILQQISLLLSQRGEDLGYVSLRWIPGTVMPADILSRNFVHKIGKFFPMQRIPNKLFRSVKELPPPTEPNVLQPPHSVWCTRAR